ncbi:hypothetical protein [Aneurinibacillus sp. REN35]|uniref:hypothetical protein n=1 Tax=Aneurinibacillus sp. REN35 TaxID=3237286 RepID=UPI0035277539
MIGIMYNIQSKEVIERIDDIQAFSDTSLVGEESAIYGINPKEADFVIVESSDLQTGDIIDLSVISDIRHLMPKTTEQNIEQIRNDYDQAIRELTMLIAMQQGV